jgi:hypothetical protein
MSHFSMEIGRHGNDCPHRFRHQCPINKLPPLFVHTHPLAHDTEHNNINPAKWPPRPLPDNSNSNQS